jgi:hypothetical protein
MAASFDRRRFLGRTAVGLGALAAGLSAEKRPVKSEEEDEDFPEPDRSYVGPNVILVRFGGGVRRAETVREPEKTWCPFIYHELARKQGVLFSNVEISSAPGIVTSHGQGTLYLLTGEYRHYEDITHKPLAERFTAPVPTLFEYLRRTYQIPSHQALIVNGEDRINEEFYTFSNHHQFGVRYRSTVLSLYRFKSYLLRQELATAKMSEKDRAEKTKKLAEMENKDYRVKDRDKAVSPEMDAFWDRWRDYYGRTGLVNPRGDRVLTALALQAIRDLRPKLMLINYQDPDYVHWGNPNFYTRAIAIIDEGVRELYSAVQATDGYRDNTIFVVVPDCGRDNNHAQAVPFQHHFNSKSAHQIFAVVAGPKLYVPQAGRVCTDPREQISVTSTVAEIMGIQAAHAQAPSLLA